MIDLLPVLYLLHHQNQWGSTMAITETVLNAGPHHHMLLHPSFLHTHMRSQSAQYDRRSHHWHMGLHHRGHPLHEDKQYDDAQWHHGGFRPHARLLVRRPTLTSAKRRSCESTAVPAVLAILSRHVLGQMRVFRDEVEVCAHVREGAKTQGEGGLCRLVHRPVVGVQEGDAYFIECRVIAGRANEAEVSEVLQSELGLIGLRYNSSIVERIKQLGIRYIQVTLGMAEGEEEESQTQVNERLHPSLVNLATASRFSGPHPFPHIFVVRLRSHGQTWYE